jgi:hypothetical protein
MVGEADGQPWREDRIRLFLSHISAEKVFVSEVREALAALGIDGFVAHEDIEPTDDWQNAIEAALKECDALVAFLHPGFHASNWTDQEVGFVLARGVLVVPVRLGDDPYGFIGRYQAIAGDDRPEVLAQAIAQVLTANDVAPGTSANAADWWREAGAPSFRPSYASSRGEPPWRFELTIRQEGGDLLPLLRAGWVGNSVPANRQPEDMEPRSPGEWRLPDLQLDPTGPIVSEPPAVEVEFAYAGRSRRQRWTWEHGTDFQNTQPHITRE